jgi:hypothetical protein
VALVPGSVQEIVRPGVSAFICRSVMEIAKRVSELDFVGIRTDLQAGFSGFP